MFCPADAPKLKTKWTIGDPKTLVGEVAGQWHPALARVGGADSAVDHRCARTCPLLQVGGSYHRNVVDEVEEKIEYIHANPVRRGLVASAVDWPWSFAQWYAGLRQGEVPIDPLA